MLAEMARIATRLLMLVDALDKVVENENAMEAAGQEFKQLLETVRTTFEPLPRPAKQELHTFQVVKSPAQLRQIVMTLY